jgi:hypothetical protein
VAIFTQSCFKYLGTILNGKEPSDDINFVQKMFLIRNMKSYLKNVFAKLEN